MPDNHEQVRARVRDHAFRSLSFEQVQSTNLYLDQKVHEKGAKLGPEFQNIVVTKPSILVFADDQPMANFGHDCRYLLYDPRNANLHSEIPARFPPFTDASRSTLKPFHQPIQAKANPDEFGVLPRLRCPVIIPDGNRYAILYSGMSNMRHLNDLEFCYRMLIDYYAFDTKRIYVLNYDGTLNTQDGAPGLWPGDNTNYRIKVTAKGDRASFQAAFNDLKAKIGGDDLLFIHTNNHGDNFGSGSFLATFPNFGTYMASDFCSDLKVLPKFKSLIVMMEQCNSGGFNAPVLAASPATNSSIASAAIATQSSWSSPDGNWDSFARDWIAAQIGHQPNGGALASNPDTNMDGVIEATEAFNYALAVQNPQDSPNFSQSSTAGGAVTLDQQYIWWWWWCWIILPVIEKYWPTVPPTPPDPTFFEKIAQITPELQQLMVPVLDKTALGMRRQLQPKVEAIVKAAFERPAARKAGAKPKRRAPASGSR